MKSPVRLILSFTGFALSAALASSADPIKHEFLAIDEGLSNLLYVNEANPAKDYVVSIAKPHPRDMQLEGNGKLLISHDEHLITNAADEIWVAGGDGRLLPWKGTFQEYKNTLLLAPPAPK